MMNIQRQTVLAEARTQLRMNESMLEMLKGNTPLEELVSLRDVWVTPLEELVREMEGGISLQTASTRGSRIALSGDSTDDNTNEEDGT